MAAGPQSAPPARKKKIRKRRRRSLRSRALWKFSNLQRIFYRPAGWIVLAWVWTVNRMVRVDRRGPAFDFIREGRPFIFTFWHQDCMPLMFEMSRGFRRDPPVFMVSLGRTGSLGAYLLSLFNTESVAGSGSKKGIRAVKRLAARSRKRSQTVYILADGSRGPNREMRWGALYLARDAGIPIIAGRAWSNRYVCLGWTWMRLAVPVPWGRQVVLTSEPLYVPADADKEELHRCQDELQRRLDDLCEASAAYFEEGEKAAEAFGPPIKRFPVPPAVQSARPD